MKIHIAEVVSLQGTEQDEASGTLVGISSTSLACTLHFPYIRVRGVDDIYQREQILCKEIE